MSNRVYEANKHGGQCNPRIPREWKERKGGNFPRGEINSTSECVPRIRFPLDGILQDLSSASVFQETIHTREKEREDEKKRSRDYSTPFLQPLNDAKKDRTGFLRRPEARPYWPVSIEIRTCASRPRRRLWPLDTGGPVVEIERGKKRGKGGRGGRVRGKNFRPPTPFVQQVLGSWPQMLPVCIHQFSSRIVRWKPMTSLFSHG